MGNTPPETRIKIKLEELVIKPLDPNLDRAAFSCGDESISSNKDLSTYFRDYAADHHQKGWVRVYVGLHDGKIVAYYWLSTQGADPAKMSRETKESMGRIELRSIDGP